MKKIILFLLFAHPTFLFSQSESKNLIDKKSISGQYGYDIRSQRGEFNGLLTLTYLENNNFKFKIEVNNSRGVSGDIDGIIQISNSGNAIFGNSDCDTLEFKISTNLVSIRETNCSYFHGAGTSFDGFYSRPIKPEVDTTRSTKRPTKKLDWNH